MADRSAMDSGSVGLRSEAAIAECAYYKAERRSFMPGHELEDWLAAEQELANGGTKRKRVRNAAVKAEKMTNGTGKRAARA